MNLCLCKAVHDLTSGCLFYRNGFCLSKAKHCAIDDHYVYLRNRHLHHFTNHFRQAKKPADMVDLFLEGVNA